MTLKLLFPKTSTKHKYFPIHFSYIIHTASIAGIEVVMSPPTDHVWVGTIDNKEVDIPIVSCTLNNKQIIIDFMDHPDREYSHLFPSVPYFKMQFDPNINTSTNIFPMGPVYGVGFQSKNADSLKAFLDMCNSPIPTSTTDTISNRQKIHGSPDAQERRRTVQQLLVDTFKSRLDYIPTDTKVGYGKTHNEYWNSIRTSRVVVCAPGATKNSLDRNQIEAIALGCCTISPSIPIMLPFSTRLVPGEHYISCNDDFSDLVDCVRWCDGHLEEVHAVRERAKKLFAETCSPEKVWTYIISILKI